MLKFVALLFLAQASFAHAIVNNYPTRDDAIDIRPKEEIHPNYHTNKCLGLPGGVIADGAPVQICDCNGTPAQQWYIRPESTAVELADTGLCLDAGPSLADGAPLKIRECCNDFLPQEWLYTPQHHIVLKGADFAVDLKNGNLTNGNAVQLWKSSSSNANQIWTTTKV